MSYQSRGNLDYANVAKKGFFIGVALFVFGAAGELLCHAYLALPAVAERVFLGVEVTGVAVGLLVPIVVGAVLPLTE